MNRLIQPPDRTGRAGTILIICLITLFTLYIYVPSALGPWILTAMVTLLVAAWILRIAQAVHVGLLGFFTLVCMSIPALATAWPSSILLAIALYGMIVATVPWLRRSAGWIRPGHLSRSDLLLVLILAILTALVLLGWIVLARPDLSDLVETVPDAAPLTLVFFGFLFALINSFGEEVLYRGAFMYALESALGSETAALLTQAMYFGLLHINGFPRGPSGMVLAALFGVVCGFLRLKTRGMLASWITHFIVNALMYLYLAHSG